MRTTRLLIDADGVLLDFTTAALAVYQQVTGHGPDPKVMEEWEFTKGLVFDNDHDKRVFDGVLASQGFCESIAPTPGSIDAITQIRELGVDIHVVTAPYKSSPTWTHTRTLSLAKHFGFGHEQIHHSSGKHVFSGDLFVDDKPENVQSWSEHFPNGAAFLWDTIGNRKTSAFRRLFSWQELLDVITPRVRRATRRVLP